jgi:hypothetical protein
VARLTMGWFFPFKAVVWLVFQYWRVVFRRVRNTQSIQVDFAVKGEMF